MTTRLGPVLSADDIPLPELCSARLDGEIFPLAESWFPIDEIDAPRTRALAAAALVAPRAIAERMTAAWIYGVAAEPSPHQFCVDVGARIHIAPSPRAQLREVHCPPADTITIAGLRVTTPARTIVDLARWSESDSAALTALLVALVRHGGLADTRPARRLCQRTNGPHCALALTRIAHAQSVLDAGATALGGAGRVSRR